MSEDFLAQPNIVLPMWDAPANIKAFTTTRQNGFSHTPYESFNLAMHVDDDSQRVLKNRQMLRQWLPSEPIWLNQIHSCDVVEATLNTSNVKADGSFTTQASVVLAVLTADCLPVLISNKHGTAVAAVHAGWRGLANGILEQGVQQFIAAAQCQPSDLLVWLGPAIGPRVFEVGEDVRQAFLKEQQSIEAIKACFVASNTLHTKSNNSEIKWLADLYQLAKLRLAAIGVENCTGGNYCTYSEKERFYSYRRDGCTGRMASLIWFE